MVMRGVQKTSATSVTSCTLGYFDTVVELRAQSLELLGANKTRLSSKAILGSQSLHMWK